MLAVAIKITLPKLTIKAKVSNLMRLMNKMLYSVFVFQFLIISLWATLSLVWMGNHREKQQYLEIKGEPGFTQWVLQFFTYQVAYSHMIPISLYVIIEMLKLIQAKMINKDVRMSFAEASETQLPICQNSDLIEELGQVEFVFSDKTGTLTRNEMELKKVQVGTTVYGN